MNCSNFFRRKKCNKKKCTIIISNEIVATRYLQDPLPNCFIVYGFMVLVVNEREREKDRGRRGEGEDVRWREREE